MPPGCKVVTFLKGAAFESRRVNRSTPRNTRLGLRVRVEVRQKNVNQYSIRNFPFLWHTFLNILIVTHGNALKIELKAQIDVCIPLSFNRLLSI